MLFRSCFEKLDTDCQDISVSFTCYGGELEGKTAHIFDATSDKGSCARSDATIDSLVSKFSPNGERRLETLRPTNNVHRRWREWKIAPPALLMFVHVFPCQPILKLEVNRTMGRYLKLSSAAVDSLFLIQSSAWSLFCSTSAGGP